MATFTELVAAVVVQSSAAAYSHFGVTLEPVKIEQPSAERIVARSPPRQPLRLTDCPTPSAPLRGRSDKA